MTKPGNRPVIQQAHAGRWHTMTGHGVPIPEYEAKVEEWNLRDGWPGWRVADASTDREPGAPTEPVLEPTPFEEGEIRDLLRIGRASLERALDPEERARLKEISLAHRFERMPDEDRALIVRIKDEMGTP